MGDMRQLKRNLTKYVAQPEGGHECLVSDIVEALVPHVYSLSKLEDLLLAASKMDSRNCFIVCDTETALLNIKDM